MLSDLLIRSVIDMIRIFIQAEQPLFQCIILKLGARNGWSVVTIVVCFLTCSFS